MKYIIGDKIPADKVHIYIDRAWLYLKRVTLNRIAAYEEYDDVAIAVSAVAEVLYEHTERGVLASENNDGYSVSFRNTDMYTEAYKTALQYLPPEILYRGMQVAGDGVC